MYNKEKTTALLSRFFALLCNGSTADSGSVCPGSSPGEATLPTPKVGIFFVPHYLFLLYFPTKRTNGTPPRPTEYQSFRSYSFTSCKKRSIMDNSVSF